MRRIGFLGVVLLAVLSSPAWAQREGAQLGEGFMAKVVGTAREHPVAVGGGAAASAAAIAALIRELNRRNKEEQDRG